MMEKDFTYFCKIYRRVEALKPREKEITEREMETAFKRLQKVLGV